MKTGRKSIMEFRDPQGNLVHVTDGDNLSTFNKYYFEKEHVLPQPLIRGDEIMNVFSLPQGPYIGELIKRVKEAQAERRINTKKDAIEYIKKIINLK